MLDEIEARFRTAAPVADYASLRVVRSRDEHLSVRRNVVQPPHVSDDAGAMLTVYDGGGIGYAATSDLSVAGLARAAETALEWARRTAGRAVTDFARAPRVAHRGEYLSPVHIPWQSTSIADKIDLLRRESERLKVDDRIVDWDAGLWHSDEETLLLTSEGGNIRQ